MDELEENVNVKIGKGNFGTVYKKKFKNKEYLLKKEQKITFASMEVALKELNNGTWMGIFSYK